MLGVDFFLQTNFDCDHFDCDHFSQSYRGLKIAIFANLGQLTRDIFRANNA